jgi:hypothetical protein
MTETDGHSSAGALGQVVARLHKQVFLFALGIGLLLAGIATAAGADRAVLLAIVVALVVVLCVAVLGWRLDERHKLEASWSGASTEVGAGGALEDSSTEFYASGTSGPVRAQTKVGKGGMVKNSGTKTVVGPASDAASERKPDS